MGVSSFAVLFFILWLSVGSSSVSQLANDVCKNSTDFKFCIQAIYSDPHAPTSNQFDLAYVVFKLAYVNATDTRDYISSVLPYGSGLTRESLVKCKGYYEKAVQNLSEALQDMDLDTYSDLSGFVGEVADAADDCQAAVSCTNSDVECPIPFRHLLKANRNLSGLSNICAVLSKLF